VLNTTAGPYILDRDEFDIVRITAAGALAPSPALPQELGGRVVEPALGARTRRFTLSGKSEINDKEMDMSCIDEVIPARAREIWEISASGCEHNFHIHDAAFGILDIDSAPPPAHLRGRKTPSSYPKTQKFASQLSSAVMPTRPHRTCTTATSCSTKTGK
jgi:FtsP/CotA-like multicopper oxidase with cupredoxin domain